MAETFDQNYQAFVEVQQGSAYFQPSESLQVVDVGADPAQPTERQQRAATKERMKLEEQTSKLAIDDQMAQPEPEGATPPAETGSTGSASKPKRVRTGCLTCRERHLKCDEGVPTCINCRKSNRACKRGVRLNFIDTKVEDTRIVPPSADWNVNFQDESREIASEYKGGAGRYAVLHPDEMDVSTNDPQIQVSESLVNAPLLSHQTLPPIQSSPPEQHNSYPQPQMHENGQDGMHQAQSSVSSARSSISMYTPSQHSYASSEHTLAQPEVRDCLNSAEETLFMQVFVEEVGLWMDSMDPHKHVRRPHPLMIQLTSPVLKSSPILRPE